MKLKLKGAEISRFELDLRLLLPLRCNLILRVSPESGLLLWQYTKQRLSVLLLTNRIESGVQIWGLVKEPWNLLSGHGVKFAKRPGSQQVMPICCEVCWAARQSLLKWIRETQHRSISWLFEQKQIKAHPFDEDNKEDKSEIYFCCAN